MVEQVSITCLESPHITVPREIFGDENGRAISGTSIANLENGDSALLWLIAQRFTRREQMTLQIINYTKTEGKRR